MTYRTDSDIKEEQWERMNAPHLFQEQMGRTTFRNCKVSQSCNGPFAMLLFPSWASTTRRCRRKCCR
jgi:hypothetical protein